MARNLKSYRKNDRNEKSSDQTRNESQTDSAQLDGDGMANIESMMNAYGGKSETELFYELKRMTDKQKKDGSFDALAMHKTAESIMPMLTPEQRQKLIGIMNMLGK